MWFDFSPSLFLALLQQLPRVPSDSAAVPGRLAVCHHGRQHHSLSVGAPAAFANGRLIQKPLLLYGVSMTDYLPVIASSQETHVPVPQTLNVHSAVCDRADDTQTCRNSGEHGHHHSGSGVSAKGVCIAWPSESKSTRVVVDAKQGVIICLCWC